MAVGETPADFERWVEPHLTVLTRYAGATPHPPIATTWCVGR